MLNEECTFGGFCPGFDCICDHEGGCHTCPTAIGYDEFCKQEELKANNIKKEVFIMRNTQMDQHVKDYQESLIHPVYKFKLPEYKEQIARTTKFKPINKTPEPARDCHSVLNHYYTVDFHLPNKPKEVHTGKVIHVNPIGDDIYYTLECPQGHKVFTRKYKEQNWVTVTAAVKPKTKKYPEVDLTKINFKATEILQLDRKAKLPEVQGIYNISYNTKDVQDRYWAAINGRAIPIYTDGGQFVDIPVPFNNLIIQYYQLKIYSEPNKFMKWAIINMETTRFIIKQILLEDKAHKSTKDRNINNDVIIPVNVDITIQKGDFNTFNSLMAHFKNILDNAKDEKILNDNLKRIARLYTKRVRRTIGLEDTKDVLTADFETKMLETIRKYGRDYGIYVPERTEYGTGYAAFKKDTLANKGNNSFIGSMVIYEDPKDQKEFIDNQRTMVLPRARAKILAQTEELVVLHETFITLMYILQNTPEDTALSNDIVAQSECYTKRLNRLQDLQDYKYFCEVNNIPYDPKDLD